MSLQTSRGIYLDLNESTYFYNFKNLIFYFSSQLYLNKFRDNVINYASMQQKIFENSYKCKIEDNSLFAIKYYKLIEKRGFRVEIKNNKERQLLEEYNLKLMF